MLRDALLPRGVLAAAVLASVVVAQTCPDPGNNFWKNDKLPQVPIGPFPAAIIQGLCEGEALGAVFTLAPGDPPQKLTEVAVGFGHVTGAGGFNATANVEIYDGVTFPGGIPVLGPKIFDLNDAAAASMQVISHGINTLDIANFNVIVGAGVDNFVVAFRSNINPNGSCAGGFPANYMTDYDGANPNCVATPQRNLIDIAGTGWRDASTATVQGFPICGGLFNAYNGDWMIRACSEDAGEPAFVNLGFALSGNFSPALDGTGDPSPGGSFTLELTGMPPGISFPLFVGVVQINAPFKGGTFVPGPILTVTLPTVFGVLSLPATMPVTVPPGTELFLQGWFADPGGPKGASSTNGLKINV